MNKKYKCKNKEKNFITHF